MRHALLCLAALLLPAGSAFAAAASIAPVQLTQAWIRWLPANLPAAGYAVIQNDGSQTLRLVGAASPDYGQVMLHRSQEVHGVDRMSMVASLAIPAHGQVKLSPGGYHLMLSDARHPIQPGERVTIILHFANGQTLQADFPVRPANASGP